MERFEQEKLINSVNSSKDVVEYEDSVEAVGFGRVVGDLAC